MKDKVLNRVVLSVISFFAIFILINCGGDDSSLDGKSAEIIFTGSISNFGSIDVLSHSESQAFQIKGSNLTESLMVKPSANFEVSKDGTNFSNQITLDKDVTNAGNSTVYVRFSPLETAVGNISGTLTLQSPQATTIIISLSGKGLSIVPVLNVSKTSISFADTRNTKISDASTFTVNGSYLQAAIGLNVTGNFEISLDGNSYTNVLEIAAAEANNETTVYVRFIPTMLGDNSGTLTISNNLVTDMDIALFGKSVPIIYNFKTFTDQVITPARQTAITTFNLHTDNSNIETIKMFIKLRCPQGGCDAWDRYANIKVKDKSSGQWYEMGRYITPYGVGNAQLGRGFEIDVTDFKSLLEGSTELYARIETWEKGWEVSVEFDFIEGNADYPYYAISKVFAYDDFSTSGVVYGGPTTNFDLDKSISIPANAESTHLRTVISGWGHATPAANGRGCAEWCFRTHQIKINGSNTFEHQMGPLGCSSNVVQPQGGNWTGDRAGWCPGMVVPVRVNKFSSNMAGNNLTFEYDYQDWVADGGTTATGYSAGAYYATSVFVIVKSNTPINKPQVQN